MSKSSSGGGAGTASPAGARESRGAAAPAVRPANLARGLRDHIATLKGDAGERPAADAFVDRLSKLDRPTLFATLKAAGVEGAKHGDSKKAMLNRARLRLTAAVRARERQEH